MAQRKKTRAKKRRTRTASGSGEHLRLALAGLFLVGFLIASLVVLSSLRRDDRPAAQAPPRTVDAEQLRQDIQVELESAILRSGASLDALHESRVGTLRRLDVAGRFPEPQVLAELSQRLHRLAPDIELLVVAPERRLDLQKGGETLFTLIFAPELYRPVPDGRPRVALIMDDLGRDMSLAEQAIALEPRITLAVLPNERHAAEIATLAHRRGREVMVHIPMEPEGYPAANPGEGALFVDQSAAEIKRRFLSYLDRIPYAAGGNNHMGSRFTSSRAGMEAVLEVMRGEGLFFVDSRTTGNSVALDEARRLQVPATARDVFLDNELDVERIARQIRKLAVLAGKHGTAVGICHPHPETLTALRQELPELTRSGISIVPVAQLVSR